MNPIYPIGVAAGLGLSALGEANGNSKAKRRQDWLDFNQRKQQPGFDVNTDPYVTSRRNMHAQNPNMDKMQQAANAQPRLPRPNAIPNTKTNASSNIFSPPGTKGGNVNNSQPSNQGSMVASNNTPNKPNGNFFTGSSPYVSTASLLNPAQQQAQSNLLPDVSNRLRNPINFNDISNETIRKYNQEVLPKIAASHFNRTGAKASSPDYAQRLIGGGQDLQTRLAAQRAEFEQNARTQDQNLLGTLMGHSQESFYNPGDPGLLKGFANKAANKVGEFALDKGFDYIKSLWSSDPTKAASETAGIMSKLSPDEKSKLVEYVTTGAGKSAPQSVKDSIIQNAAPTSSSVFTGGNIAKTLGITTVAGLIGYYGGKWLWPLLMDEGE